MRLINEITADPNQKHRLTLDYGTQIEFELKYKSNQAGWYYTASYNVGTIQFTVSQRRLVASPNMLRQFRNIIPFGFACVVDDGEEPVFVDDFVLNRARFYLLSQADKDAVEEKIALGQVR